MYRYLIRFGKEGNLKYISHLDMVRLFKRLFKRAGIALAYSQGFNPHPKMSLCQPLSLGYSSKAELLEFECTAGHDGEDIVKRLRSYAPAGLSIYDCEVLPEGKKSPASSIREADWKILIPGAGEAISEEVLASFLSRDKIEIEKLSRKSGKKRLVDIKPMILRLKLSGDNEGGDCVLEAGLSSGSENNLSPELFLDALLGFAGLKTDRSEIEVERLKLIY